MNVTRPVLAFVLSNISNSHIERVVIAPAHHLAESLYDQPIFLRRAVAQQSKAAVPLLQKLLDDVLFRAEIVVLYAGRYRNGFGCFALFILESLVELLVYLVDVGPELQRRRLAFFEQY